MRQLHQRIFNRVLPRPPLPEWRWRKKGVGLRKASQEKITHTPRDGLGLFLDRTATARAHGIPDRRLAPFPPTVRPVLRGLPWRLSFLPWKRLKALRLALDLNIQWQVFRSRHAPRARDTWDGRWRPVASPCRRPKDVAQPPAKYPPHREKTARREPLTTDRHISRVNLLALPRASKLNADRLLATILAHTVLQKSKNPRMNISSWDSELFVQSD